MNEKEPIYVILPKPDSLQTINQIARASETVDSLRANLQSVFGNNFAFLSPDVTPNVSHGNGHFFKVVLGEGAQMKYGFEEKDENRKPSPRDDITMAFDVE